MKDETAALVSPFLGVHSTPSTLCIRHSRFRILPQFHAPYTFTSSLSLYRVFNPINPTNRASLSPDPRGRRPAQLNTSDARAVAVRAARHARQERCGREDGGRCAAGGGVNTDACAEGGGKGRRRSGRAVIRRKHMGLGPCQAGRRRLRRLGFNGGIPWRFGVRMICREKRIEQKKLV